MDKEAEQFVLDIIGKESDLTLATVRPDGYPQATTVSYASDGMTIYVGVGKGSQKADNIRQNPKVSLTINTDYKDWNHIKGLSMGALAQILTDPAEIRHAAECMAKRFPQVAEWANAGPGSEVAFLKISPQVISMLNYEKGFGHTDLVRI